MNEKPCTGEDLSSIHELVEQRTRSLFEKLSTTYTLEDLQAEVSALNELIETYKRKDEMLEKLLDKATPASTQNRIRETLQALQIEVANHRTELAEQHKRSHQLIQKSIALIIRAQREIDKCAHRHAGYSLEICGLCKGMGFNSENPCPPCKGKGTILVRQPALKCPRCKEDGTPTAADRESFVTSVCIVCRGAGWVMSIDQIEASDGQ